MFTLNAVVNRDDGTEHEIRYGCLSLDDLHLVTDKFLLNLNVTSCVFIIARTKPLAPR